ncbi:MAG: toll/interleukin-1 receptor domain-containing protein, partial [Parvularculaceae bacterium]
MGEHKYRAFISYSHADEKWGDWLHRALETYRAPKALVGGKTLFGPVPERLTPIFRDRADLPAAGSLNAEIEAALSASLFQIVICSPQAARSRWVNEEIKYFKRVHGPGRVLALIVAGEPMASATPGREDEECFPPALRFHVDAAGAVTNEAAEPVAADARRERDGRRYALLKVAAGLIGVKLDDLIQREAARRAQRARLVMGGSAAIAMVMVFFAAAALLAREEAFRMRTQAENLIEFMLTDLR